jgi:hypothetical protein
MELRKQAGKVLANPSGTAPNTAFWQIMSGLPMAGYGLATGNTTAMAAGAIPSMVAGGANLAARAFTNPNIIRWMVKQTTVPAGALKQQLAILAKDAAKWDPESQDIASDLSDTLGNIDWRSMLLATAVADQTH